MSGRSVNPTTLFLGRLRPPKRLTSIKCPYFRQKKWQLPFLNQRKGNGSIWSDWVSNPGPLALESDALPTALQFPNLINPFLTSGLVHHCHLDESISSFRVFLWMLSSYCILHTKSCKRTVQTPIRRRVQFSHLYPKRSSGLQAVQK